MKIKNYFNYKKIEKKKTKINRENRKKEREKNIEKRIFY